MEKTLGSKYIPWYSPIKLLKKKTKIILLKEVYLTININIHVIKVQ